MSGYSLLGVCARALPYSSDQQQDQRQGLASPVTFPLYLFAIAPVWVPSGGTPTPLGLLAPLPHPSRDNTGHQPPEWSGRVFRIASPYLYRGVLARRNDEEGQEGTKGWWDRGQRSESLKPALPGAGAEGWTGFALCSCHFLRRALTPLSLDGEGPPAGRVGDHGCYAPTVPAWLDPPQSSSPFIRKERSTISPALEPGCTRWRSYRGESSPLVTGNGQRLVPV